jgi:ATP-binding cassette subfamily F protein 3
MDCLKAYKGTILFVSHDRGFMEALSTKTLELSYRELYSAGAAPNAGDLPVIRQHRLFYGNYAYYLERISQEIEGGVNVLPEPLSRAQSAPARESARLQTAVISASERREQEKQKQAQIKRLERRESEILKSMEDLEVQKSRLEEEFSRPEVYSSGEKSRTVKLKLDECSAALEVTSREWETVAEELEKTRGV